MDYLQFCERFDFLMIHLGLTFLITILISLSSYIMFDFYNVLGFMSKVLSFTNGKPFTCGYCMSLWITIPVLFIWFTPPFLPFSAFSMFAFWIFVINICIPIIVSFIFQSRLRLWLLKLSGNL